MTRDDPEMLDLLLGAIFYYNPSQEGAMAVHTIMLPDQRWGREPRSVIWDDEAGTVSGGHSDVPWMQEVLAKPTPVNFSDEGRKLFLLDPAHDPADFWHRLLVAFWPIAQVQGMGGGDIRFPNISSPMRFKREMDEAKGRAKSVQS